MCLSFTDNLEFLKVVVARMSRGGFKCSMREINISRGSLQGENCFGRDLRGCFSDKSEKMKELGSGWRGIITP